MRMGFEGMVAWMVVVVVSEVVLCFSVVVQGHLVAEH